MAAHVTTKKEIFKRLRTHAAQIRDCGVHRLGLFGSFARDAAHLDSDVDLLVEFEPGAKTFDSFMTLADLLDKILARRVELVTRESLSPHLGPRILAETENVPLSPPRRLPEAVAGGAHDGGKG